MAVDRRAFVRRGVKGFTLIEIITAVVLVAIIMIPLALMAMEYVRSIAYADSLTSAQGLARREMAIVNNLSYDTLASGSYPNYMGSNFDVSRQVSFATGFGSAVKKALVTVMPHGSAQKLIELAAYAMNVSFGAGGGARASSFSASGGAFTSSNQLAGMLLTNTNAAAIAGVIMTSTRTRTLSAITIGGTAVYTSPPTVSLGSAQTQVTFQNNFAMSPGVPYSATFTFTGAPAAQSYTVTIIFVFNDGSQSASYSRTFSP